MKKIIKRFWGVGLVIIILSSLFVAATPVSAAEALRWESKTGGPSSVSLTQATGTDVLDFTVASDAKAAYAVTRVFGNTGAVTTAITETDNVSETLSITYINEAGVAGRTGSVVVPDSAAVGAACTVTLQAGDSHMADITAMAVTTSDATAGVIVIKSGGVTAAVTLATWTFGVGFTDSGLASPGTDSLMQSTSGGSSWTNITNRLPTGTFGRLDYVAIAPDDPNVVVVAASIPTAAATGVAISVNGGTTFTSMGFLGTATTILNGLEVSPVVTGGFRYVSVYGQDGTTNARLWYYAYGAGVGGWYDAINTTLFASLPTDRVLMDDLVALAFSPSFQSDYMAVAVSEINDAVTPFYGTKLHILSFNFPSAGWDNNIATGYPTTIATSTAAIAIAKADIALGPDYMGGDDTLRIAFVGASINLGTATEIGGVWRCTDSTTPRKIYGTAVAGEGIAINSLSFDGTNLAAGSYISNNVFRSADPLAATPTFVSARSFKRIGIDDTTSADTNDYTQVQYVGETLYGSKRGVGSAMSKSLDDGNTWNDFSLIDFTTTVIDDIYVSADGATWYMAVHDAATSNIFRMSPMQRVLCVATGPDFILRGVSTDANVIYAADYSGTTIYYSADGGVSRWQQRLNVPAAIADLAVESANVIYFGSGVNVYKSINNGFTWNLPVNTTANSGTIYTLVSLGENKLLAGTTGTNVLFSKDGATTWTRTFGISGGTNIQVAATGLDSGNYIFGAPGNSNVIYRCDIGASNPLNQFNSMNGPAATADAEVTTGLVLTGGVLYAISTNSASNTYLNSTLYPANAGTHPPELWRTRYNSGDYAATLSFARAPSALKTSTATGKIVLWAIDISGSNGVKYYDDTLATVGPKINAPNDKALVQANSVTGLPMALNLMWARPSLATGYEVALALDANFSSQVNIDSLGTTDGDVAADVGGSYATMSLIVPTPATVGLNPGSTYYWRVRASLPISSAWSETRSFTIQPMAAAVPAVSSPANGSTISNQSPAFSWSPVTSTTKYEFQLSTTPTFGTTVLTDTPASAGTLVPVTIKLEQGKQYFWRVRALEPVQGDWSTVANFVVAVPAPPTTSAPPVVITQIPAPVITITAAPTVPAITLKPADVTEIAPTYIWAIIIIGAILVIAVIVLIVRTRRSV